MTDLFGGVPPEDYAPPASNPAVRVSAPGQKTGGIDLFGGVPPSWYGKGAASGSAGVTSTAHTPSPALSTPPASGAMISAEPDRNFFQKMMDSVRGIGLPSKDKASNIMALADEKGVSPLAAQDNYDALTMGLRDQPLVSDIVKGAGETGLHLGTGFAGQLVGGLAASRAIASGAAPSKISGVYNQVSDALTYQPRTEMGKTLSTAATAPFALFPKAAKVAGDYVFDKTGNPDLAASVATVIEGIPVAMMGEGAFKSAWKAIAESTPYRMATIPERGLVVQSLKETVAKNPEMTQADLVKMSDQYFKDAHAERMKTENPLSSEPVPSGPSPLPGSDVPVAPIHATGEPAPVLPVSDGVVAPPVEILSPHDTQLKAMLTRAGVPERVVPDMGDTPAVVSPGVSVPGEAVPPVTAGSSPESFGDKGKPSKVSTAGQNIRTLRGAIKAKGGLISLILPVNSGICLCP